MRKTEPLYGWMKGGPPRPLRPATPPLEGLVRVRNSNVVPLRRSRLFRMGAAFVRAGSGVANALLVGALVLLLWPA